MLKQNDIRQFETSTDFEYGVCIDNDGDLAIAIRVRRKGRLPEAYVVKVRELHPDYHDGGKFERACMVAAAYWRPLGDVLQKPFGKAVDDANDK